LRVAALSRAEVFVAAVGLVPGAGRFVAGKIACFGLGIAAVPRGVLVLTGDSRLATRGLGKSSATCSMASSRASIASTESSIRAPYLEGDRLMIPSTKESGPSPVCCSIVIIRPGVLVLIDPTNESSLLCHAA
jgi:hypothetical protein